MNNYNFIKHNSRLLLHNYTCRLKGLSYLSIIKLLFLTSSLVHTIVGFIYYFIIFGTVTLPVHNKFIVCMCSIVNNKNHIDNMYSPRIIYLTFEVSLGLYNKDISTFMSDTDILKKYHKLAKHSNKVNNYPIRIWHTIYRFLRTFLEIPIECWLDKVSLVFLKLLKTFLRNFCELLTNSIKIRISGLFVDWSILIFLKIVYHQINTSRNKYYELIDQRFTLHLTTRQCHWYGK